MSKPENNPAFEIAYRNVCNHEADPLNRVELAQSMISTSPEASKWFLARAIKRHDELVDANISAKEKLQKAMALVDKVMADPHHLGHFLAASKEENGAKALVHTGNGYAEVGLADGINADEFSRGDPVLLTSEKNLIVSASRYGCLEGGHLMRFVRYLDDGRLLLSHQDRETIAREAESASGETFVKGDLVRVQRLDDQTVFAAERVIPPKPDDMFVTPRKTFADLGGLERQIAGLKWELDKRRMPATGSNYGRKGSHLTKILMTGPTGTGKSCLAQAIAAYEGEQTGRKPRFCSIAIDQWGSSYMFETEARMAASVNSLKSAAREDENSVVVMFVDEIDWLTRHRGQAMGLHGDRIQNEFLILLSDPDWPENLIFVSASNLLSEIDTAARRRLADYTVAVPRPNRRAATQILNVYLTDELTYHAASGEADAVRKELIDAAVSRLYSANGDSDLLRATFRDSQTRTIRAADLLNGAELERLFLHASDRAQRREFETDDRGLRLDDIHYAIDRYFESAILGVTPANLHNYVDDLPNGIPATKIEPIPRSGAASRKYWRVA